eukprot:TRINITY_DN22793_c0_g1_i2.p1 TRINITY_DN22793_c0_g1~~TRINITY_DN22793_c0_g1_i2.p1  ORF type:complete len:782 (-),score=127.92 TRINITY_DN22793_c0_g1_i2:29-2374(-)
MPSAFELYDDRDRGNPFTQALDLQLHTFRRAIIQAYQCSMANPLQKQSDSSFESVPWEHWQNGKLVEAEERNDQCNEDFDDEAPSLSIRPSFAPGPGLQLGNTKVDWQDKASTCNGTSEADGHPATGSLELMTFAGWDSPNGHQANGSPEIGAKGDMTNGHYANGSPEIGAYGWDTPEAYADTCEEEASNLEKQWGSLVCSLMEAGRNGTLQKVQADLELEFYESWTHKPKPAQVKRGKSISLRTSVARLDLGIGASDSDLVDKHGQIKKSNGFCGRCIVHPENDTRMVWTMVGMFLVAYDMVAIPLTMFDLGETANKNLEILGYMTFVYWLMDLLLQFVFGIEQDGRIELRPYYIAKMYIRSPWFTLDCFLIILDVALFTMEAVEASSSGLESAKMLRSFRLLRFARVVRISRMKTLVALLSRRFTNLYILTGAKVLSGLGMMLTVNHFIACAFVALAEAEVDGRSWKISSGLQGASFPEVYSYALHWSLTQFMPATNNIAPDNSVERVFAILVILLAMGVFSSFISSITNAVNTLRSVTSAQRAEKSMLRQFFSERQLSTALYAAVTDYIDSHGALKLQVQESNVRCLREIPPKLKFQLHVEVYMKTLQSASWLTPDIISLNPMFFSEVCHNIVKEQISGPSAEVFHSDMECHDALILTGGTWTYYNFDSAQGIEPPSMSWLCEVCLWSHWLYRGRLVSACSSVYCSINGPKFADAAYKTGGQLHQALKVIGILVAGEIEERSDDKVNDLSLGEEVMEDIAQRSLLFLDMVTKGKSQLQ